MYSLYQVEVVSLFLGYQDFLSCMNVEAYQVMFLHYRDDCMVFLLSVDTVDSD